MQDSADKGSTGVRSSGIINDRPFTHTLSVSPEATFHCLCEWPAQAMVKIERGGGGGPNPGLTTPTQHSPNLPHLHPFAVTYTTSGKRHPCTDSNTSVTQTITIEWQPNKTLARLGNDNNRFPSPCQNFLTFFRLSQQRTFWAAVWRGFGAYLCEWSISAWVAGRILHRLSYTITAQDAMLWLVSHAHTHHTHRLAARRRFPPLFADHDPGRSDNCVVRQKINEKMSETEGNETWRVDCWFLH